MTEITPEQVEFIYRRALAQMFDMWVRPELERRRQEGILPNDFVLQRAQVIMNHGRSPEVLLNDQVRAILKVELVEGGEKIPGDAVSANEVDSIAGIELTSQDPNAGHMTLIRWKGEWICLRLSL